jgi:hypothetical protein
MSLQELPPFPEAPLEPHELDHFARKHGTSVDYVKEVIKQTHARTREEIEAALEQRFSARKGACLVDGDASGPGAA